MNKVILIKNHLLRNLRKVVSEKVKRFNSGERIAIKLHMGEYGNLNYLRPPIVGLVVEELKKMGAKPFLVDSLTAYQGSRHTIEDYKETARRNGFTEETIGCPIIISNTGISLKSKYVSKLEVIKELYEADGLVVLSHFKGHELTNYGAGIKNLAMGGYTKETKSIMHSETGPIMIGECTACGACVEACPEDAIEIKEGKAVVDYSKCFGCCACVDNCPQKAWALKSERLSRILTEAASHIVKKFGEKSLYINVLMDIAQKCDCLPIGDQEAGPIVSPNIGIVVSDDIVAIDKASLVLVEKETNGSFGKIFKSKLDEQIVSAPDFGLSDGKYELEIIE